MIEIMNLPVLLSRRHFVQDLGLSDSLYYKLLNTNAVPVVTLGNRRFIHRDKFFQLLEQPVRICNDGQA